MITGWAVDMLREVRLSENEACAKVAADVLDGRITLEVAKGRSGDFLNAVLDGDIWGAWLRADNMNRRCLARFFARYDVYNKMFLPKDK